MRELRNGDPNANCINRIVRDGTDHGHCVRHGYTDTDFVFNSREPGNVILRLSSISRFNLYAREVLRPIGIRQRLIPSDLIGRVMGIFRAALSAGGVIGALGSGVLADATSVGTVAVTAGALQLPVVLALAIGLGRPHMDSRTS